MKWIAAALLVVVPRLADAGVRASSELRDDDGRHGAAQAFDGKMSTGWAEAQDDAGVGSWLEIDLERSTPVVGVSIWPGNLSTGARSVKEYGRPRTVTVEISGAGEPTVKQVRLEDGAEVGPQRVDVPIRGDARKVRITIDEVYDGIVFSNQTWISEVAINFAEGEEHPWVGKIFSWYESDAGQAAREANDAEVIELFDQARSEEDAEAAAEALADLMQRAGDGPAFLHERVNRYVPIGYWMHALPPDEKAVDALLKLKDPTAIPALEQASLRVLGHDERRLQEVVDRFYAYQELIGGPNPNVPNWGQEGWAVGELQAFGEPLDIEVDQAGRVFVADTGNNRVQRFSETGLSVEVWGAPEPDTANVWMGDTRSWYVSGAAPGEDAGQFVNPLDIALIPGKFEDAFAVLDATGRVQIFDETGAFVREWKVPVHNFPLISGVGGEAYILWARGELVVLWSDSAFVYDREGTEINTWNITDGTASGAVVLKNGKLGLIFQQEMVQYSTDGFRHGAIVGEELGEGFESWDADLDEDGKLWALTDTGWLTKFKRPGKIDFQVKVTDYSVTLPRISVHDNVVYLLEDETITRIDALEAVAREQAAQADG